MGHDQLAARLALERDGSNTLLRRYLYGRQRISMTTPSGSYYYHYDALGSVANLSSASGDTQWTYEYEPYGGTRTETQNDPNAPANPMKFAGELLDDSGLYALGAREYDPATGRFLRLDPLTFGTTPSDGAISGYLYADDQPTLRVDPSGMKAVTSRDKGTDTALLVVSSADSPNCFKIDPNDRCYVPKPTPTLIYPFAKGIPKKDVGGGVHPTFGLEKAGIPPHPAIDFGAPAYTPVYAVVSGRTYWRDGGSNPAKKPDCHHGLLPNQPVDRHRLLLRPPANAPRDKSRLRLSRRPGRHDRQLAPVETVRKDP